MPTARIDLVTQNSARDENESYVMGSLYSDFKDAGAIDCQFQVVVNPANKQSRVFMTHAEIYNASTSFSGGGNENGTAIKNWTGQGGAIVQAFGNTNSTIYENTTSRGAITGLGIFMSETTISGVANCVIVSAGNRAYYLAAGVLTEITNGNFPPKQGTPLTITGNFVHADGYAFIACTNGQIWHSDLNSIANWSATSFLSANDVPDALVGLAKIGRYIVAVGLQTTQFFYVAGNPGGSVLTRAQIPTIQQGAINQYCIVQYKDVVAIVGQGSYGAGVFLLSTDGVKKISNFAIDQLITTKYATIRLHVISQWGRPLLYFGYTDTPNSSLVTTGFMYDDQIGMWIYMYFSSIANADTVALQGNALYGTVFIGYNANGRYYLNSYFPGGTGRVKIGPWDAGRPDVRKTIWGARLIGQSRSARPVTLSYSDDDGLTWITELTKTIDDASAATLRPEWNRLGSTYRRMWQVSLQPNGSDLAGELGRLEALMVDYDLAEF